MMISEMSGFELLNPIIVACEAFQTAVVVGNFLAG